MVPYQNTNNSSYINIGNISYGPTTTTTIPIDENYPAFCFYASSLENLDFTEEKECNESERVICKGTSTRRELKKLSNRTGYKARKEFWK